MLVPDFVKAMSCLCCSPLLLLPLSCCCVANRVTSCSVSDGDRLRTAKRVHTYALCYQKSTAPVDQAADCQTRHSVKSLYLTGLCCLKKKKNKGCCEGQRDYAVMLLISTSSSPRSEKSQRTMHWTVSADFILLFFNIWHWFAWTDKQFCISGLRDKLAVPLWESSKFAALCRTKIIVRCHQLLHGRLCANKQSCCVLARGSGV